MNLLIQSCAGIFSFGRAVVSLRDKWTKKPSVINFYRSQKVPRKLKREVFGYS